MSGSLLNTTFASQSTSGLIGLACCVLLLPPPALGREKADRALPKVLMIDAEGPAISDAGLYKAIRAQLSGVPLTLGRIRLPRDAVDHGAPLTDAARLAKENSASMVFWIEDDEMCRMHFFIPDAKGGRVNTRVLELDLNSRSSRFEVIAIAVASMVEGLLSDRRLKPAPKPPQAEPEPSPPTPPQAPRRKWLEIIIGYAGSWLASESVTHGARVGLWSLPVENLAISLSYRQTIPEKIGEKRYELTLVSRQVEASVAGRIVARPIDVRLGVAWTVDFRSFSVVPKSDQIEAKPADTKAIHSIVPFASLTWNVFESVAFFGLVGASLGINDTVYQLQIGEDTNADYVDALDPLRAQMQFQAGLLLRI